MISCDEGELYSRTAPALNNISLFKVFTVQMSLVELLILNPFITAFILTTITVLHDIQLIMTFFYF